MSNLTQWYLFLYSAPHLQLVSVISCSYSSIDNIECFFVFSGAVSLSDIIFKSKRFHLFSSCLLSRTSLSSIIHVRRLPERGLSWQSRRKRTVMKIILKTCVVVSILGSPTLIFLFSFKHDRLQYWFCSSKFVYSHFATNTCRS